jgi:hypothetical protein
LFVEVAGLAVDPEVNDNTSGFGDLQAGFKWVFQSRPDRLTTFQLRAFAPTGDAERGLGTRHISLEPALLAYQQLNACWTLEGELRYWIPVSGTEDRAGPVLRCGLGLTYDGIGRTPSGIRLRPVFEAVGWTMVNGQARFATPPGGPVVIEQVDGDTIVNLKVGARLTINWCNDLYLGYGRGVTGHHWYDDVVRLEWRYSY